MSTPEQGPIENVEEKAVGEGGPPVPPALTEAQTEIVNQVARHLAEKWGYPAPCPYCRNAAWEIDPTPAILHRLGQPPGIGVPVFLVWCTVCGNEVHIQLALTGLWDKFFAPPEPSVDEPAA